MAERQVVLEPREGAGTWSTASEDSPGVKAHDRAAAGEGILGTAAAAAGRPAAPDPLTAKGPGGIGSTTTSDGIADAGMADPALCQPRRA